MQQLYIPITNSSLKKRSKIVLIRMNIAPIFDSAKILGYFNFISYLYPLIWMCIDKKTYETLKVTDLHCYYWGKFCTSFIDVE